MPSQFIYASVPSQPMGSYELIQLVEQAQRNNRKSAITGMLAFSGDHFLQVLEGEMEAIAATYAKIEKDPRHRCLHILGVMTCGRRRFEDWSMGYAGIGSFNQDLLQQHLGMTVLAPQRIGPAAALGLLEALARAGK